MEAVPVWPGESEIESRISRLKGNMSRAALDALVITSQHNFEYYSGFRTLIWLSDTRPYMAIARRDRPGISIIVVRGEADERLGCVDRVEYDGFTGAAIDAAGNFLSDLPRAASIGLDYGRDMYGRGSINLINFLQGSPRNFQLSDAADLIWLQRVIKSEHELKSKRAACKIATDAFFAGLADLRPGMNEYEFGQILKRRMIDLGADSVDWLPVRFGREDLMGTYGKPNSDRKVQVDDFVWVDMGVRRADQISDVNRLAKVGKPTPEQEACYEFVRGVTLRVAEGVRPGMSGGDAFALFERFWSASELSTIGKLNTSTAGRVGHGSGIALTEPPSLKAGSTEIIQEDMVLHVEPKLIAVGGVFQTEEIFRVTPKGPEFLTKIAPPKLPIVEF